MESNLREVPQSFWYNLMVFTRIHLWDHHPDRIFCSTWKVLPQALEVHWTSVTLGWFSCPWISCKWDRAVCVLLCLASFIERNV